MSQLVASQMTRPGIAAGASVSQPVTTMDLAATFLDFAGVGEHQKPPGMTSRSLRPLLQQQQGGGGGGDDDDDSTTTSVRAVVHSGLANFRVVVVDTALLPLHGGADRV